MIVLSFDVGGTAIKSAIVNQNGEIEGYRETETPRNIANGLINLAHEYRGYDAVSVSTAGIVDSQNGTVVYSSDALGYKDNETVAAAMKSALGVPVYIENDVNCAAIGEHAFGAAKGLENFVCMTFGTSIGGAIFINGGLYNGRRNMAGEIGHIITHAGGRSCPCGGSGCYSEYASVSALVREAQKIDPKLSNGRIICENIDHPKVKNIIESWADEVSMGVAAVIHIFDPEAVILGGGIMNDSIIFDIIRGRLNAFLMPSYRGERLRQAATGNRAGLLGAAAIAFGKGEWA